MGACTSKHSNPNPYAPTVQQTEYPETPNPSLTPVPENDSGAGKKTPIFPFYSPSPARYFLGKKSSPAPGNSTPRRFFRRPPSPAKHIKAVLVRRKGKGNGEVIDEEGKEGEKGGLDKSFGYSKEFKSGYEVGEEVGRGHFGYTCSAKALKGELKGQQVAVKIIPKSKMTTAIAIEDVRREVKILKGLKGHNNLAQFYDAFEDKDNVYIIMEK